MRETRGRQWFGFVLGHVVISGVKVLLVLPLQFLHQHCVALSLLNIPIARSANSTNNNLRSQHYFIYTSVELLVVEEDSEPAISCSRTSQ